LFNPKPITIGQKSGGKMSITLETLKKDEQANAYIQASNEALKAIGFTEHSFPHLTHTAQTAGMILGELGFGDKRSNWQKYRAICMI